MQVRALSFGATHATTRPVFRTCAVKTMSNPKSDFLRVITERGYMHQCTDLDALDQAFQDQMVTAYIGFDCTADSLHVGSLLQIMMLRWLQKTGNKPIVLMGGGTSKIGDPSFKDEARKLLSEEDIARNKAGIQTVFDKYLAFGDGPSDSVMVDNADWLDKLEYIPFLRSSARISRSSDAQRLGQAPSRARAVAEFS